MKRLLFLTLTVLIASSGIAQETASNFNQAKLHLANHKLDRAIPILEGLWAKDPKNANLNYLLGLCYVKEDHQIRKSVELLETASEIYTSEYASGSSQERRAPEYVYYYLTIAYSKNGQCEEALRALNKFYQVYTYNDEYYLVDGQKWVRECNLKDKEEVEEEVAVVEEPLEEPVAVVEESSPISEEQAEEEFRQDIAQEIQEERTEPKIKERLVPFDDWDELRTREIDYTTMSSLYGVQIAALIDLKPTREFDNLNNVEVYVDENGIFRYVIGRFSYHKQAESLLEKIRERGYTDAFIVDVNRPTYEQEVLGVGTENINWHINGSVDFRVQIGAFRTIVPSAVAEKYLDVDGIRENQQNDLVIMTVGNFAQYDEAARYREELKSLGIEDAFVVSFNLGNKIPLKEAIDYATENPEVQAKSHERPGAKKKKRADF
ncbi:MAG: tetratricopeptide repeat protein [Flavobacteriales bacterium]|nr:tetratricopeptide repeat protein [Flavobacteriales bacterium]